jgi:hypothetical protein
VRKHAYPLDRIYQHRISVFKPNRTPGLFFVGLGLLSLTAGIGGSSFEFSGFSIHLFSLVLGPGAILIMVGTFLMVSAIGFMVVMKEKYAVHIVMPDEEKDVLVSQRRQTHRDRVNEDDLVSRTGESPHEVVLRMRVMVPPVLAAEADYRAISQHVCELRPARFP